MPNTEALGLLREQIKQGCELCPWKNVKACTVSSDGPLDAEVAVIGRNPGTKEDEEQCPFVGPGGEKLNIFLALCGINRSRCYVSNTSKCFGGKGDPPPTREVYKTCVHWIFKEIELLQPKVMIVLGNDAYHWVLGYEGSVTLNQGSLLPTQFGNTKVIPVSHPGYWLRKWEYVDGVKREKYFEDVIIDQVCPRIREHLKSLSIQGMHPVNKCEACGNFYKEKCPCQAS